MEKEQAVCPECGWASGEVDVKVKHVSDIEHQIIRPEKS